MEQQREKTRAKWTEIELVPDSVMRLVEQREFGSVIGKVLEMESLTEQHSVRMSVPDLESKRESKSVRERESVSVMDLDSPLDLLETPSVHW